MGNGDADDSVDNVIARAATATSVEDIQGLADRAIVQIRELAGQAVVKARQVDSLMQRLSEVLEQDSNGQ